MTLYGYARVSTRDQDLAGQVAELTAVGCARVYRETASGAKADRVELGRVLARLEADDVLVVTRLDRLARSTRDLLNLLAGVSTRGAGFRSLKDAWADTTSPHGRLMLTVLGGLAEFERELIRSRTGDGRKRAMDRGVRFGRPYKMTAHQRQEAMARVANGETFADIARSYNVDASTICRPDLFNELGAKFLLLALHIRHLGCDRNLLGEYCRAIPFDSGSRCKSHVAPLSEDIDLK
jgi:DNA invertase Pin-like site-specific DNA recombinase